jgi:hypothetical protein
MLADSMIGRGSVTSLSRCSQLAQALRVVNST